MLRGTRLEDEKVGFLVAFIVLPLVLGVVVVAAFRVASLRRESEPRTRVGLNAGFAGCRSGIDFA